MNYTFLPENDMNAFEKFVLANGGIYMQSSLWAKVKLEWHSAFYSGFDENGTRVLTALVMDRHIPGVGKIFYTPAGAVCDYENAELLKSYAAFIKAEVRKAGGAAYFFDPCVELRINGEKQEKGVRLHRALTDSGFRLNTDASHCLYKAPVQLMLPLKDENGNEKTPAGLLKSFEKGVRYSVRIGENRGLSEKVFTIDDMKNNPRIMEDFLKVMRDTSDRNDFVERGGEYCERLMSVFGPSMMDIMLIYYNKETDISLQNERLARKEELLKALETAPEKKIRGIKDEIDSIDKQTEHFEERMKETASEAENEICAAGGMTVHYNGMSSCLFGGARNLLRNNLRASHYFNFRRICRSIELENDVHDLGYVLLKNTGADADGTLAPCEPNDEFTGICDFKKSFGADYVEYAGEYILVCDKLRFFSYEHLMDKARAAQGVVNRIVKARR